MKSGVHTLITGKTDSGKSALMKRLVRERFRRSTQYKKIMVLDAKLDPGFLADYMTSDKDEFLQVVESAEDSLLIIDEGGESIGAYAGEIRRVATMHRGLGHQAFFITQRAQMFDKTMREQCSNLFCFRQSLEDARELSRTFPALREYVPEVPKLEQGEYLYVPSFGSVLRGFAW